MRREMVRKEMLRLQDADSGFIGATFFGSETKGKAKWKSDVDVAVFINTADIARQMGIPEKNLFELKHIGGKVMTAEEFNELPQHLKVTVAYRMFIEDKFKGIFAKLLLPEGVHALPIYMSKMVIEEGVKALTSKSTLFLSRSETLSMFARMFHLEVNGGIRPYREMLFLELLKFGSKGRGAWRKIIETTARLEQHEKTKHAGLNPAEIELDPNKSYPWTLERAMKMYAPSLLK